MERPSFGQLLRRHRIAAGLTQIQLAERAGISVRAVGDLERGVKRRPHLTTLRLLADALDLDDGERAHLNAVIVRLRQARPPPAVPSGWDSAHGLPAPRTSFVGREGELAAVHELLTGKEARLITLTGTAGTGKTRLALEAAVRLLDHFADGVFFVSLASIGDATLVPFAVARLLGVQEVSGDDMHDLLAAYVREKHLLLILDTFEHVLDAGLFVSRLLASSPGLNVLVTSRSILHLTGEYQVIVPPMTVPGEQDAHDSAELERYEAVSLFTQRAQALQRDFELTDETAAAVVQICRRLDGLPLAIELAAARISMFSPQILLDRLAHRLDELTGGLRDLPERQQTLRSAIHWSCALLDESDRRLFLRLAVFSGGFSDEAAEAVCGSDAEDHTVMNGLASLVDNSLLRDDEAEPVIRRYSMLETIREYALELLAADGDAETMYRRHAEYYIAEAERGEIELRGARQPIWLSRLEGEHDNFRAALGRAKLRDDAEIGLRLAAPLWRLWHVHGHLFEGRRWLEAFLSSDVDVPSGTRAAALIGAGILAMEQGEYDVAGERCREALYLFRQVNDTRGVARALNNLGLIASYQAEYAQSRERYVEALAAFDAVGDLSGAASATCNIGLLDQMQGNYDSAREWLERSVHLFQQLGDRQSVARSLSNLGLVAANQGDGERAAALYEESLALFRALDDRQSVARVLINVGSVAEDRRARAALSESLTLLQELGDHWSAAFCLEEVASRLAPKGAVLEAAHLWGAASALRSQLHAPRPLDEQRALLEQQLAARTDVEPTAFESALKEGSALSFDDAIPLALGYCPRL